ncbi:2-C-methyl-D-erythritol 2,4-cyclodiphosphate synthase, partial [Streptomyces caniscabiei]|nr:2-C-methyl-D-erythritol 2,4-cyclodiphosphate synthase [Streptomyces caniscabiei]
MGSETTPGALPGSLPGAVVLPQVGIGTDIHAFEEGRELWCAGLKWEG